MIAVFFFQLDLLPVELNLMGIVGFDFAEDMGVTENEFVVEGICHIDNVEGIFFFTDFGIKEYVE